MFSVVKHHELPYNIHVSERSDNMARFLTQLIIAIIPSLFVFAFIYYIKHRIIRIVVFSFYITLLLLFFIYPDFITLSLILACPFLIFCFAGLVFIVAAILNIIDNEKPLLERIVTGYLLLFLGSGFVLIGSSGVVFFSCSFFGEKWGSCADWWPFWLFRWYFEWFLATIFIFVPYKIYVYLTNRDI